MVSPASISHITDLHHYFLINLATSFSLDILKLLLHFFNRLGLLGNNLIVKILRDLIIIFFVLFDCCYFLRLFLTLSLTDVNINIFNLLFNSSGITLIHAFSLNDRLALGI